MRLRRLSVVKDQGGKRQTVGPESLDVEKRSILDEYVSLSSSKGVVVGALIGEESWDVRPMILHSGNIFIVRVSDPQLVLHTEKYSSFLSFLGKCEEKSFLGEGASFGEDRGKIWVRRRFFDQLLESKESRKIDTRAQIDAIQNVIRIVKSLHQQELIHGHICPSNIVLIENKPSFIDFGFAVNTMSEKSSDIAPEIVTGEKPSPSCDVYGLGVTIKSLGIFASSKEIQETLDSMTDSEPSNRPTLSEVEEVFLPDAGEHYKQRVSSGRFIKSRQKKESLFSNIDQEIDEFDQGERSSEILPKPRHSISDPISFVLYGISIALLLVFLLWKGGILFDFETNNGGLGEDPILLENYWRSGQPSAMSQVARKAAVEGSDLAQSIIINSVKEGTAPTTVNTAILKTAFDPKWEVSLSRTDRTFVLRMALPDLVRGNAGQLPELNTLHPGVLFALISSLDVTTPGNQFSQVSLMKMAELPMPYGNAFARLSSLGVSNLEDPSAKALAHILKNDLSSFVLTTYFNPNEELAFSLSKLLILDSLSEFLPDLDKTLIDFLPKSGLKIAPIIGWFFTDSDLVGWDKISPRIKISISVGKLPDTGLMLEHYADLVQFPLLMVREGSLDKLKTYFAEQKTLKILEYIKRVPATKLTREQNVLFLLALHAPEDQAATIFTQWFNMNPDPDTVLSFLILRQQTNSIDPFSIHAARYLAHSQWNAPLAILKILAAHQEPLARTLAYMKLRPDKPQERAVLEASAKVEPNLRNRDLIKDRLKVTETGTQ